MSGFASIVGQQRPVRILTSLYRKKMIPHALLFTGHEGVGKRGAARALAMLCNCSGPKEPGVGRSEARCAAVGGVQPCGVCRSCRKIMAANHPDVMQVKPERSTLKIAQIRALCDVLALKPFEARVRVVIISDAHAMSPAAANALLKMLEEPPSRTVLILIAPQRSDLLPTVVSRCQCVRFNPIPAAAIAARLTEEHGIGPNAARILATVAEGSLARARALAASDWLSYRSWLIAATGLATGPKTVSQDTGRLLAVAERLSADKQLAADSLATLLTWLRDVIVCRLDPGRVINTDLRDELRSASQQVDAPTILGRMEAVRTAQKNLAANANLRLTLEVMMLKLAAH